MKYILKKDLPLAKAGMEVELWIQAINSDTIPMFPIKWDEYTSSRKCLWMIFEKDIPEWLEEIKEPKTIYDLKDGDKYYYLNNNQIKVLMQSRWDLEFSHDANVYIFLTEREAKRNKLLRELATRTDKWLPDEREFYTTYNDYMNACKVHWNWKACDMIQYHMWIVFRNEEEYNKWMTEEAKDLLFNI